MTKTPMDEAFVSLEMPSVRGDQTPDPRSVWVSGHEMGNPSSEKEGGGGGGGGKGNAMRFLRCLFFPVILVYYSITIYVAPCIGAYMDRFFTRFFLFIGRMCCCVCFCDFWKNMSACIFLEFKDGKFPASSKSLGDWKGKTAAELDKDVTWIRGSQLVTKKDGDKARLVSGGIKPEDIAQGQLGNCWLMASLACLAEFDGSIMQCFETRQYNPRGRYVVRLYDGLQKTWRRIVVDDLFPTVNGGTPVFAQPNGNELWVLVLEKAFAKYCGSYHSLAGGLMLWGLEAITGDNVLHFSRDDGSGEWVKHEIIHMSTPEFPRRAGIKECKPREAHNSDTMFDILAKYDSMKSVIGAGSEKGGDATDSAENAKNGICRGHAYSVVQVKKAGGYRLLQLRNPWGFFEWTGDWSDKSEKWKQNPIAATMCGHGKSGSADGMFWMEMSDFVKYFDQIDVCSRTTGVKDLVIDLREDDGCAGPCKGCIFGCAKYYCLCKGCVALCLGRESSKETVQVGGGCCCV